MNWSASGYSRSFEQLDTRIQRWIYTQGWNELRNVQEEAIPVIGKGAQDVLLAAATAAGKTEAAFLPILNRLLNVQPQQRAVVYVSPLKALINDQWGRLAALCQHVEIPVIPWHGDISSRIKQAFIKKPHGVLLITPESLEAICVTRGSWLPTLTAALDYLVVDELHAFIGTERGKQLQSLLNRLELVAGRKLPRVGLSATLGDMNLAAEFLRPDKGSGVRLIVDSTQSGSLQLLVKGVLDRPSCADDPTPKQEPGFEDLVSGGLLDIGADLYKKLRGSNNLVFPNSRNRVELLADLLRRCCDREGIPNEFWPHHGSLAREIREESETALKRGDRPATAICTTTLELGIDIGAVRSIAQIGAPPSVASLRQRMGRSGRRAGEAAILRCYAMESPCTAHSDLSDLLREGLVQTIAMLRLLLARWFEPPMVRGIHASTLVQQILSVIAERGGARAGQLWNILTHDGTFANLTQAEFLALLRQLGACDLLIQGPSGVLLHGALGEKMVNHYSFYSAFQTDEEFRLVCQGRALGALPIHRPLVVGQFIVFAGRRWLVLDVDMDKKLITVKPGPGGTPPAFGGGSGKVHDRVRAEMRRVLSESGEIGYLDSVARALLREARHYYREAGLEKRTRLDSGNGVLLLTWRGDRTNDALALLLKKQGLQAINAGLMVQIANADDRQVLDGLRSISQQVEADPSVLLEDVKNLQREKWDWALPDALLKKSFASIHLDLESARVVAESLLHQGGGGKGGVTA
ncbi:ATP-dependent RNA helicase SrmB [Candidatus Magnetaquicoccaceae bacterium FCR-1]|uniref:ATP-dependent RNA helicase SrmB n=1 Tax=Candidatus Magnetaquiglobus chichijimensis TaxID=3141448 RepID=A0ABQ0CAL0_9PROT